MLIKICFLVLSLISCVKSSVNYRNYTDESRDRFISFAKIHSAGPCISPEPKPSKTEDKLKNALLTKEFFVPMASTSYAFSFAYWAKGEVMGNETLVSCYRLKFGPGPTDITLKTHDKSGTVHIKPVVPSVHQVWLPGREKDTALFITVWSNDKYTLNVGCCSGFGKFWVVYSPFEHFIDEETKKTVFEKLKDFGFKYGPQNHPGQDFSVASPYSNDCPIKTK